MGEKASPKRKAIANYNTLWIRFFLDMREWVNKLDKAYNDLIVELVDKQRDIAKKIKTEKKEHLRERLFGKLQAYAEVLEILGVK